MRTAKLSEVAEINPRKPRSVKERTDPVAFLGMADVGEDGTFTVSEQRAVPDVIKGYTYFERGDVLIAKITPCLENGKATFLESLPTDIGFGSTEFHVVRPGPEADARYLFYLLWNPAFRHVAERNMTGTAGQQRVPTHFLERVPVPLPPLDEQRRIAAILDKADAIRRKRREANRTVESLLQSIFMEFFGDPVLNPKGWPQATIKSLCDRIVDCPHSTPKYSAEPTGLYCVRSSDIQAGVFDFSGTSHLTEMGYHTRTKALVPAEGDVVYCREGARLGNAAVVPPNTSVALGQRMMMFRVNREKATSLYLWGCLNSPNFKRRIWSHVGGSASPHVNVRDLRNTAIPVPPLEAMRRYESAGRIVRKMRTRGAAFEADDGQLFDSLLQRAFAGSLGVQDAS